MQTLKTALVVVGLLALLYAAHQFLNNQPIGLPWEAGEVSEATLGEEWGEPSGVSVEAPPVGSFPPQETAAPPAMPSSYPNAPMAVSSPPGLAPPTAASRTAPLTEPAGQGEAAVAYGAAPAQHVAEATASNAAAASDGASVEPPPAAGLGGAAAALGGAAPAPLVQSAENPQAKNDEGSSSEASSTDGTPGGPAGTPIAREGARARYPSQAVAKYALEQAWRKAELQVGEGRLARALLTLSVFYRHPDLDDQSHTKLNERLDQLAGTVIYSTRHLLEPAYKVRRGETLSEIAQRHDVPVRLLQNINGVQDPNLVLPGTELKVLRGPFRAEIDLARGELTLFLGGLYAGRFPVRTGSDPAPRPGEYQVLDIQPGRTYYAPTGEAIAAGNPANPYGAWWIDLGRDVSIHGSPEAGSPAGAGCLSLSSRDAADVAAILSLGSQVLIR